MAGKKKTKSNTPEPEKPSNDAVPAAVQVPVIEVQSAKSSKKKKFSMSEGSGVVMPVSRILRYMRKAHYANIIQKGAAVYTAAVLEYLVAETLEMAGDACMDNNKKRINPRHICIAIRNDEEMNDLCRNVTISEGGVVPFIHQSLLPKLTAKKNAATTSPMVSESYGK